MAAQEPHRPAPRRPLARTNHGITPKKEMASISLAEVESAVAASYAPMTPSTVPPPLDSSTPLTPAQILAMPTPTPALSPEPPRVTPRPVTPAPAPGNSLGLARFVREDGTLDLEQIYTVGRVGETALPVDKVVNALKALPPELPEAIRRTMVLNVVSAVGAAAGVSADEVVADADLKRLRLLQFLESLDGEIDRETGGVLTEIRRLEAKVEQLRQQIATPLRTLEAARAASRVHLADLGEVVDLLKSKPA